MNLILKARHFCERCFSFVKRKKGSLYRIVDIKIHHNAFVFGAPYHSNAGDQAQSMCIKRWINANYPNYIVRIYNTDMLTWNQFGEMQFIRKYINKSDKVFLHSGYHTTDLYMLEENMQRKTLELFKDRQIVLFPQTILYQNKCEEEKATQIYNAHPNTLLMCRDEVSFSLANSIFPKCKRVLFPDVVTTLIGNRHYDFERKGILLCMRNDKEGRLNAQERKELIHRLEAIDSVELTDTTLDIEGSYFCDNREEILEELWKKYAHYRVVVTDRYHGTIFSLIAGTPVIVMPSTDHKLESGVRWFPKSFDGYVQYVPDFSKIIESVQRIYHSSYSYKLPNYFECEYYSKLRGIIEENV